MFVIFVLLHFVYEEIFFFTFGVSTRMAKQTENTKIVYGRFF